MDSKKIVLRLTLQIDSPLAFMLALKEEKAIGREPTDEIKRGKVQNNKVWVNKILERFVWV